MDRHEHTETITIQLDPSLYEFLEGVTQEKAPGCTVEEYVEILVKESVATYLTVIECNAARKGISSEDIVLAFLIQCEDEFAPSYIRKKCWPWIGEDAPSSFEERVEEAKMRGHRVAVKCAYEIRRAKQRNENPDDAIIAAQRKEGSA